jgi:NAD(P)-dependent dehydrogenase (short-subunit alcohol dehydrogenase family)
MAALDMDYHDTQAQKVILITGASSGFGRMSAEALALAGHTVYGSMRGTTGKNAGNAGQMAQYAEDHHADLRTLELDVADDASIAAAVQQIIAAHGRIDVVMHNAGHMVYGPSEAFTPEQLAQLFDTNVLGTQRLNRAVLPHMRAAGRGLLLWNSSSSVAGGTPPWLGPYFAVKAAMDALAIVYARELTLWGIETAILVPGAFTKGTNHFANAGKPDDQACADAYDNGPYAGYADKIKAAFADIVPDDADPAAVAREVVRIVAMPDGQRPFRSVVDPSHDGADVGFAVTDRLRAEMLHRTGLGELLKTVLHHRA